MLDDALVWLNNAVTSINWTVAAEVIKTAAPVVTAFIAFKALQNWKRQEKAKRQTEFLDALLDATHAFLAEIRKPVSIYEVSQLGFQAYGPYWTDEIDESKLLEGAISYIEERGDQDGKELFAALSEAQPSLIRLRALAAKGQVFHFPAYPNCHDTIEAITEVYAALEGCAAMLRSNSMHWENPEVRQALESIVSVKPSELRTRLERNNANVIEFAAGVYKRIYG